MGAGLVRCMELAITAINMAKKKSSTQPVADKHDRLVNHVNREIGVAGNIPLHFRVKELEDDLTFLYTVIAFYFIASSAIMLLSGFGEGKE